MNNAETNARNTFLISACKINLMMDTAIELGKVHLRGLVVVFGPEFTITRVQISAWAYLKIVSSLT